MLDILTAADVRRQDAAAAERGIPTTILMERAGAAVARAVRELMGGTYGRRVAVVCGKGNNGGDGLVAARHLAAMGAAPVVVLCAEPSAYAGAAAEALAAFRGRRASLAGLPTLLERSDCVVDALLGVGLDRAPDGAPAEAIRAIEASAAPVVAVDVPSGVVAGTGAVPGDSVHAALTVTFGGPKPGLLFEPGRSRAGRVVVASIGMPEDLRRGTAVALEAADVAAALPRRSAAGHKRDAGVVLVVAGSIPMPGAAALVAGASVWSGAGLTILAAPEPVCRIALARVPEIVTIPLGGSGEGTIDDKALEQIRPRLGEAKVLAIGPGLTTHAAAAGAIRSLIAEAACPVVADADAITALAAEPAVVTSRTAPTLLTPHAGELARLAGSDAATLDADRLTAAREAAGRLAATILFKGPGTVVAGDGETYVTVPGGRALAQGGTGDVLTGLAASLIAQAGAGASVPLLAAVAAWLHSTAGDALGERRAPLPASPSLLIDEIAATIHEVTA